MLNMLDTQDNLKNFSEAQLIREMQMPSGAAPQFMVLGEIERRKRMRADSQRQQGLMQPTVAQEAVTAAGVPQQGIAGIAQSLAPQTDMTQNTGVPNVRAAGLPGQPNQPQRMADGGVLKLAPGGDLDPQSSILVTDPAIISMASRSNMSVAEYISSLPPEIRAERLRMRLESDALYPDGVDDTGAPLYSPRGFSGVAPTSSPRPLGRPQRIEDEAGITARVDDYVELNPEQAEEFFTRQDAESDSNYLAPNPLAVPQTLASGPDYADRFAVEPEYTFRGDVLPYLAGVAGDAGGAMVNPVIDGVNRLGGALATPATEANFRDRFEVSQSPFAGGESTQAQITRLRGIIDDPNADTVARANAAQELERLQQTVAVNEFGGNIAATAAGGGLEIPPGYMLTAMGLQLDPTYQTPGTTGISLLDQAAVGGGTPAVQELIDAGVVSPGQGEDAMPRARMTDYEGDIVSIDQQIYDLERTLGNPYLPEELAADMTTRIAALEAEKDALGASVVRQAPGLFQPESPSIAGGFEGLIDTTPAAPSVETSTPPSDTPEGIETLLPPEVSPLADTPSSGTPSSDTPSSDTPSSGTPSSGTPSSGTPSSGTSDDGAPASGSNMDQDKWLALAQAGFTLMSTGDFGKAGQAGLAAYSQYKQAAQDARKLEAELALLDARTQAALRPPSSGGGRTPRVALGDLNYARERLSDLEGQLAALPGADPTYLFGALGGDDQYAAERTRLAREIAAVQGQIATLEQLKFGSPIGAAGLPTGQGVDVDVRDN